MKLIKVHYTVQISQCGQNPSTEKMGLYTLLLFCGLVSLGEQLSVKAAPAQSGGPSASLPQDRVVQLQIEVDAPDPWSLSVGDTVEIRCVLTSDSELKDTETLDVHLRRRTPRSMETLSTFQSSRGKEISFTLRSVRLEHSGLYSCEGDTTHPQIKVQSVHKFIWVKDPLSAVNLKLLRVNRVKYFYAKTLTIGCELPRDESHWRIVSANEKTGNISDCPNQERSGDVLTCTIPSLPYPVSKSRQYDPVWCESSNRQRSNVLNVTEAETAEERSHDLFVTKFGVTPAWFVKEGDSVVFHCDVRRDKMNNSEKCDLQLIWTKRNPANDMTVLLSQRASTPINHTLSKITHEHSGVYSCLDDGTLSNIEALPWHHFLWVQDASPPVTIDVLSHNRTQFVHNEVMTVGCQLPNDQSQWKLKGFDQWTGIIKECEKSELSSSRLLSCTMKMGYPWSDYLFWCESPTGIRSNVLNITNTVGLDVLEAPPLPVMEGDDLTLRCLLKNKVTGKFTPEAAFFKHNLRTFEFSNTGSVTIKNVTKENEGLYNCRLENEVATLTSYVTVKARPVE